MSYAGDDDANGWRGCLHVVFFPPFVAKVSKHDLQVVFFLSADFPELVPVLNGEQLKQHEKTHAFGHLLCPEVSGMSKPPCSAGICSKTMRLGSMGETNGWSMLVMLVISCDINFSTVD